MARRMKYEPNPNAPLLAEVQQGWKALGLPTNMATSLNETVLAFHKRALEIISEEQAAAVKAIREVGDDLRSDIRRARQFGIYKLAKAAIETRLRDAAGPVMQLIAEAQAIVDQAMNREPGDPTAAVSYWLRVADTRRQVEALDPGARVQACSRLAELAHPAWVEVFLGSVASPVPENLTEELTGLYQLAFAGERAPLLQAAKDAQEELDGVIRNAVLAMGLSLGSLNMKLSELDSFPSLEIVKAWPAATKSRFIAAYGEEAYRALLQGDADVSEYLGFFRPGLVAR